MRSSVYITALGKFLPGKPITNDEIEDYLGLIGGKPSRLKSRILKQNGIQTRHYAINRDGQVLYWNCDLASQAVKDALANSELNASDIQYLAAATSSGDLIAPGFASMVHGELKLPPCEIASISGICASGMMALKTAYLGILAGERTNSAVCASEFTSRFFRPGIFEETKMYKENKKISFDSEFLRWMLSDGAGAAILENRPNHNGLSLKVDWIDLVSYADRFDICMYSGTKKQEGGRLGKSWYDYENFQAASQDGAILLKQDLELLENMVPLGVSRYFELIEAGKFHPSKIDWMVCHYSSHIFRGKIFELLEKSGGMIPEERWFTNLYTKGNTGAASIFIMLEELLNEGHLKPGQKILCMVPESGRFVISYMHLTVVGESALAVNTSVDEDKPTSEQPTIEELQTGQTEQTTDQIELNSKLLNDLPAMLMRRLASVWVDFETRLNCVPIIDKLNRGRFRLEDYKLLLLNLRQQVSEGARWIARAASNITIDAFALRSMFIGHAFEEHKDFELIERDYVSIGGSLEEIRSGEKNIGSEALSAWMFHRASQENPYDLFGSMFIIEGLGNRLAKKWGEKIQRQLGLKPEQVSFLLYHGANDSNHFQKLEKALGSGILTETMVNKIVKTARVTARLYLLQLEELGNI